ncbi:hypothetical protein [Sphingomonas baiyangensis]|uniref:hypothetical protein n=1 Tax=Sphingomonas baiyangensis TaxID=2572576 RepID=UPI001BAFD450|nr:hypothetical protein [Sphingomonas baiyangensis]
MADFYPPRRARVLLFALVWLSAAWFGSWHWNPNSAVRLFAAISIVEDGDATIDQFEHLTIDKARFADGYYLDKAPGMTLMAVPVVAVINLLTGDDQRGKLLDQSDPDLDRYIRLRQWAAAAIINATLLALAATMLFAMGADIARSPGAGLFGAVAFALGTPLWGWSTTLFGHAATVSLLTIAIALVWRGTQPGTAPGWRAAAAGSALGWALVIEHSALLFALPIGLWALWRMWPLAAPSRLRAIVDAVLAGSAALLPLLGYNMFAFGDPFTVGYSGVVGFDGMQQGLFGLTSPNMAALAEILWGERRGMLWVAPILVAALPGLVVLWRGGRRDLVLLALAGTLAAFLYNASYAYWDGGNSTGPRHAMPAVAFLAIGFAPAWSAAGRGGRAALAALASLSIAINLMIASAEITAPHDAPNQLIDGVWALRFAPGYLRTVPNEFFGTSPWTGLALWGVLAATIFAALISITRLGSRANIYRTHGAARHPAEA